MDSWVFIHQVRADQRKHTHKTPSRFAHDPSTTHPRSIHDQPTTHPRLTGDIVSACVFQDAQGVFKPETPKDFTTLRTS